MRDVGYYTRAFQWWKRATKQGHTQATFNVGAMLYQGRGVAHDPAEAAQWFGRMPEQEHAEKSSILTSWYYGGVGMA